MLNRITRRGLIAFSHDIIMAGTSFWLSFYLRVGDSWFLYGDAGLLIAGVTLTVISGAVFWLSGLYKGIWRYASVTDLWVITKAVTFAILIFSFVMFLWIRLESFPRSVFIINWFVMMTLLGGPRFFYRLVKDRRFDLSSGIIDTKQIPVLLVGDGDQAELFIRSLRQSGQTSYRIIGIVAEKKDRLGRAIHGVSVIGVTKDLVEIVKSLPLKNRPQRLILTGSELEGTEIRSLLDTATRLGMTLARVPRVTEFKVNFSDSLDVQPIAIEDLLGRTQKPLDRVSMRGLVTGRRILVTGAGGSIGGELVRQIAEFDPHSLLLLDQSEFALYSIDMEMEKKWPHIKKQSIIADIRDQKRINRIFSRFKPELVFHAAALKHVPLVETNTFEGLITNVIGTANVANACATENVEAMVMVSTDKAINPSSIMGASKRLAEIYCQALDLDQERASLTRYITVRFGNVLGSAGSVVPLFQKQLADGGPLTVTHQDMTRYFMTITEAVELILQASALGRHDREGKIYVLDMGEPVKIFDLASQMIRLAGLTPGVDIEIKITGARPGEKMFEELLHGAENLIPTESEGILLAAPRTADISAMLKAVNDLQRWCLDENYDEVMNLVEKFVPEFCGSGAAINKEKPE